MKKILLLALLLNTIINISQEIQERYQRAKISYNSIDGLIKLNALGVPTDHGKNLKEFYIISDFSVSEIEFAKDAGFQVTILIEDSKQHFLQQNKSTYISRNTSTCNNFYETPENFNFGTMGGYYTYQEFLDELDDMVSLYPNLITAPQNISTFLTEGTPDSSTTPPIGGNGIKWVKISDNPNSSTEGEPEIFYNAIHHAREPTSLSQLIFFMWYLLENYDTDTEIKDIVDNTELYFVPVVNPDGYLYNEKTDPNGGGFWRKNRKNTTGVDNNRNYDYFIDGDPNEGIWGGEGTSPDPESQVYPGTGPFSEVENQAIKWFCEQHNFVLGVNNHSSGNGIFFPYGYTASAFTPDHDLFLNFLGELVSKNAYFVAKTNGIAGTSNDFMYGTTGTHNKIFSLVPEIGNQFWLPANEIIPACKNMMYLNITAAKMTNGTANITSLSPLFVGNQSIINHDFTLKNLKLTGNGNYNVSINPISSNIIAVGSPISINNLEPLEETQQVIQYTLESGAAYGEDIIFELVVNNGDFDSKKVVQKRIGALETIFEDIGDNTVDNFEETDWGTNEFLFVSPSSSITDSSITFYENNENKSITLSEEISLPVSIAGATASFYTRWDIEKSEDYVQFEISIDNGVTWIPQCGKYTSEGGGFQPEGEPIYDGTQIDWVLEEVDLSEYIGESILMQFQLVTNESVTRDGFYFDDLKVNIVESGFLDVSDQEVDQFNIYPNPVIEHLNITTILNNYSIEIFTIQGQLISKSVDHSNTTTIDYSSYSKGIYIMKLTSANYSQTFKIIKN